MKRYILFFIILMVSMGLKAQWEWKNPLPQGNSLCSVFFPSADTGYAVGNCGSFFRTYNAGTDWEYIPLADSIDLLDVFFTDNLKGFAAGQKDWLDWKKGVLMATLDGGETWTELNVPLNECYLSVFFYNADTGYAASYNDLLKTTDGGSNWYHVLNQTWGSFCGDLFFTEANTGFASLNYCEIMKTIDGGSTWTSTPARGNSIFFLNKDTGYVAGGNFVPYYSSATYYGYLYKTTDAGLTWTNPFNPYYMLNSVYFTSADTGYAVGWDAEGSRIIKTVNGGNSWSEVMTCNQALYSIHFTENNTGFTSGGGGTLLKTTNQGESWAGLPFGNINNLRSIQFLNSATAYAAGDNETILKTTDGGENWVSLYNGTNRSMNSVYFTGTNNGYIAGEEGIIYKTTDAGVSWTLSHPALTDLHSVHFPSSSTGYAVGGNYGFGISGVIIKTTNAGSEWSIIKENPAECYQAVFFTNENTGFVVGFTGNSNSTGFILKTTDGGQTWERTPTSYQMYSIFFPSPQVGYAVGRLEIYKTTDGGFTWTYLSSQGRLFDLSSVYFASNDTGYTTCMYYGKIGRTTDGGQTWDVLESGTENRLSSVFFTDDTTGYVAGDGGTILKTTNGGGSAVTVKNYPLTSERLIVYPNPSSGFVTIDTPLKGTVIVFSSSGQRLMEQHVSGAPVTIDITTKPGGLYILKLISGDKVQTGFVVKSQ